MNLLKYYVPRQQARRPYSQRYQGFDRSGRRHAHPLIAWARRPTFYYEATGLGCVIGGLYIYNLETVPVSGRRRFNIVTPEQEAQQSQQMKQMVLRQYGGKILTSTDSRVRFVRRVLGRLLPATGLGDSTQSWEVFVVDDPSQKNAFVIPGGSVFVFTGILPICEDEEGLATVLGHEIAHNLAHHIGEKMSKSYLILGALFAASFLAGLPDVLSYYALDLVFNKPGSRAQESEADYIGLMLMAQSCYNPEAAVSFWRRMEQADDVKIPLFLSTHPSNDNRVAKITEWLPEAMERFHQGNCNRTLSYASDFRTALPKALMLDRL